MKRNTLNFWIDLASFLVLFALLITGLLIHYILPPCGSCSGRESGPSEELTLWGYGRHDFGKVHFYLALATGALILAHICLHWSWVCATWCNLIGLKGVSSERGEKYGIFLLLMLMIVTIILLYVAKLQVR
ncbi:MAG: DUF4405 domain-containing protein [Planctomycetota bacterium]|jgi:hypothetical protein